MTDQLPHMLRTDARENRDRILDAARETFAHRGIDATMREVARRANVGPATLYRRFPTKQSLIDAAFDDEMRTCRAIVEDGAADADPWAGLCAVIERISVLNARNQGFVDAVMSASDADLLAAHRVSLLRMIADLARRAQATGGLRPDFTIDDFVLVLIAGRGLASTSPSSREAAARRFAALAIDAFRGSDDHGSLPRGPRLV